MLARTNAAGSLTGSARGAKRTPVAAGRVKRSTRNVRQSSPAVPGHEVPAPAQVDHGVGLDLAPALGAVAAAVGEAQALEVAAGGGEHGQVLGVDGGAAERRADRGR